MPSWHLKPIRGSAQSLRLTKEAVSIGRHPDNTVPLTDDLASRFHCKIEPDRDGGYTCQDLNSRNGTRVNDVRVATAKLKPGDILRVGSHEFLVEYDGDAGPGALLESQDDAKPEDTSLDAGWTANLVETLLALPPKADAYEDVTIIDAGGKPSAALAGTSDGPNGVRLLLQLASKARATDIHVENKGEKFSVRMRVDGQMISIGLLPVRVGELIFGLIKTAAQMRAAARDAVQEGHFSARLGDRRVEYRVSFTPSVHGQKLVLRVLDDRLSPHTLSELGLAPYMAQRVKRVCDQDHGLLLVCGPTGSGKTTTLYAALREIDREARNVVTIEDPVEYQLDNVTQIPVDDDKSNSFNNLLRSVLRQDPDVILVGEIRDEETARTAMQAAMTGHVVFSTVHSKDTISAIFRLLDLKVEPFLVANALDLVLAQRLVRVLCDHCKTEIPVPPGTATRLGKYLGGKTRMCASVGCSKCLRTGYRGRRAIYELLDVNNELRDVILREPSITAMRKIIDQGLFTTLAQSGWRLVSEGATSLDEVDHVAGQG